MELPPEWRDAAVFAVEATHFPPDLREGVGEALLNIAYALRAQPDGPERVVWSALRRGASLLPTTKVDRLLGFLATDGTVDTRSVALQCVSRMYEAEPPSAVPLAVADRVHLFAERFLDPVVFTPGEPSVIARSAVSALAAVGDRRLGDALTAHPLSRAIVARSPRQGRTESALSWVDRPGFFAGTTCCCQPRQRLGVVRLKENCPQNNRVHETRIDRTWLSGDWHARPSRPKGPRHLYSPVLDRRKIHE